MSLAYFLQTCVGLIYRFSTVESNLNEQIIRLDNASNLSLNITIIDQKVADQCNNVLSSMKLESLILMITDIFLTITLIISIFPIYNYIQTKNEKILKLFATLQPANIDDMLKPVNFLLVEAFKQQKITTAQMTYQTTRESRRKKNHCQTNELQKYKKSFIFISIAFLASLITLPIFNYFEIVSISSEIKDNIALTSNNLDFFLLIETLEFHNILRVYFADKNKII